MLAYILGTLTDADIEWLSDHGECRELGPGKQVIRDGERSPDLYLILEGRLRQVPAGPSPERFGGSVQPGATAA